MIVDIVLGLGEALEYNLEENEKGFIMIGISKLKENSIKFIIIKITKRYHYISIFY